MKKLRVRVVVLGALMMMVLGCSSPPYGVELGMAEEEVRDALGEPEATSYDGGTGENGLLYRDVDDAKLLQIWFDDNGKVSRIQTLVDGKLTER